MELSREDKLHAYEETSPQVLPSGSKRKRLASHVNGQDGLQHLEEQENGHTPKRSRPATWQAEENAPLTDVSSIQGRNVRRKKGKYSLTSLSKRHAVDVLRPSKFQEGSMNDRPSQKPPSVYIRSPNHHSMNIADAHMDELMADYHEGSRGMRESLELPVSGQEHLTANQRYSTGTLESKAQHGHASKDSGMHRFGRLFTSTLNPMNVWDTFTKTFKETKDELTVRNIEENRKRAAQKLSAEQQYAEMKNNGQFSQRTYTVVKDDCTEQHYASAGEYQGQDSTPRDSAVVVAEEQPLIGTQNHLLANSSVLRAPPRQRDVSLSRQSEFEESSPEKILKSRKSLFHIRKPSLTNLKRVRSEYHLAPSRHSSSSLSPEKQSAGDVGALRPSQSRKDLHKQQKLSKRVSDLENKLQEARRELTAAITSASPLPALPSRYEKYTPIHRLSRPSFVPGNLPSLPSERLLFPDLTSGQEQSHETDTPDSTGMMPDSPASTNQSHHTEEGSESEGHLQRMEVAPPTARLPIENESIDADVDKSRGLLDSQQTNKDPSTLMADPVATKEHIGTYADLDTKLKALDASVKARQKAKKSSRAKKRKSDTDDKPYIPGRDSDDDGGWLGPSSQSKRKRKASEKSEISPRSKKAAKKGVTRKAHDTAACQPPALVNGSGSEAAVRRYEDDEPQTRIRTSIDSQLEPIFEEDTIVVAHASAKTLAPPAPRGRNRGSRSRSPSKFNITIAHRHRSVSPLPSTEFSEPNKVVNDTVSVQPGVGSVPELPRGKDLTSANKSLEKGYEWPEDVF